MLLIELDPEVRKIRSSSLKITMTSQVDACRGVGFWYHKRPGSKLAAGRYSCKTINFWSKVWALPLLWIFGFDHFLKDKTWQRCRKIRKDASTHQIAVGVYQLDVHPSADPQKIRRTDDVFRGVPRVAEDCKPKRVGLSGMLWVWKSLNGSILNNSLIMNLFYDSIYHPWLFWVHQRGPSKCLKILAPAVKSGQRWVLECWQHPVVQRFMFNSCQYLVLEVVCLAQRCWISFYVLVS